MSLNSADVASEKDRRHTVPTSTAACVRENCCEPREDGSEGLTALPRQELASGESRDNSTSNVGAACNDDTAYRAKKPMSLGGGDTDETKRPENLPAGSDETWTYVKRRVRGSNGTGHDGSKPPAKEPRNSSVGDTDGATDGRMLSQTADDDDGKYGEKQRELQPPSSREAISASRRQVPCYKELDKSCGDVGGGDTGGAKHGGTSPQTSDKDSARQRAVARAPQNLDKSEYRSLCPATKDRGKICWVVPKKPDAAGESEDDLIQLKRKSTAPPITRFAVNCDLKPSKTFYEYWLYEENFLNYRMNSDYPDSEDGKWMTFHRVEKVDEAWAWAKHLYRSGQLPEIKCMNVATAAFNPEYAHKNQNIKVICFFCGPVSNKPKMLRIGRQVARLMNYQADHIAYRTVKQYRERIPGWIYRIYEW